MPNRDLFGIPKHELSNSWPMVSDWTSFTPVLTGLGTVTGVAAFFRRVGDSLDIVVNFTAGVTAAAPGTLQLPLNLTLDSNKLFPNGIIFSTDSSLVGQWVNNGTNTNGFMLAFTGSSTNSIYFGASLGSGTPLSGANVNAIISNNSATAIQATVPVLGWGLT